jgi:hypothetical protein
LAPALSTSSVKKPRKTVRIVDIEMDHNEVSSNAIDEFEITQKIGQDSVSLVTSSV